MFLRTKEEILMESSLEETPSVTGVLTEDVMIEVHSLMERLQFDVSDYSAEDLDESVILSILSEESEEELKEKIEALNVEVEKEKTTVIKKRNLAKVLGWWTLGMFLLAGAIFLTGGVMSSTTAGMLMLSPKFSATLISGIAATSGSSAAAALLPTILYAVSSIAYVTTGILALVHRSKAKSAAARLRKFLPELRNLESRAKSQQIKDELARIEGKIEGIVAEYG